MKRDGEAEIGIRIPHTSFGVLVEAGTCLAPAGACLDQEQKRSAALLRNAQDKIARHCADLGQGPNRLAGRLERAARITCAGGSWDQRVSVRYLSDATKAY
jgi:hypothetical protein